MYILRQLYRIDCIRNLLGGGGGGERDRQTDRQTDRQRQTHRQRERERDGTVFELTGIAFVVRERERERERERWNGFRLIGIAFAVIGRCFVWTFLRFYASCIHFSLIHSCFTCPDITVLVDWAKNTVTYLLQCLVPFFFFFFLLFIFISSFATTSCWICFD